MSNDNSWIDDVIKKHRKELKELQRSKNTIEDTTNINYSQNFQTVNVNKSNNIENSPFKYEHRTITTDIPLSVPIKNDDNNLKEKLIKKKEKIHRLKNEIEQLKRENEELKRKESLIQQKENKENNDEEQYKNIIKELNNKINLLTNENAIKEKRIYQLESLKNQEIEMMNKKIKDFEVIIDENSNNYINERKSLTAQIEEYQNKLNELLLLKHNQVEHRTKLNDVAKPAELLQHLKTRKISARGGNKIQKTNSQSDLLQNKDKDLFSSSLGMRSTFFSTVKSTNNVFTNNTNTTFNKTKTLFYQPTKEIKNSYTYLRPNYCYDQLALEKAVIEYKNKQLSEKRANEEIKSFIENFGLNKSKYKSDMQHKYECNKLIELYEKKMKEEEYENENKDKMNEENDDNDIKAIFQKRSPQRNRSSASIHLKPKRSQDLGIRKQLKRTLSTVRTPQVEEISNKPERKEKVVTTEIQNVNKKNYIYKSKDEKVFDFKVKINRVDAKNKHYVYRIKHEEEIIPGELLLREKRSNGILRERVNNQKLCSFRQVDPLKTNYHNYYKPLSGYDSMNYSNFSSNRQRYIFNRNKSDFQIDNKASMTCVDFAKKNFNHDNYLEMRTTMSSFKDNELKTLKASRSLSKRIKIKDTQPIKTRDDILDGNINLVSLQNAFLSPVNNYPYPQLFLPRSGSGLLSLPIDLTKEKKKGKVASQ